MKRTHGKSKTTCVAHASADSSDILCDEFTPLASEMFVDPLDDLGRLRFAIRLQDRPLAVHPARFDPVQPRGALIGGFRRFGPISRIPASRSLR